MLKRRIRTLAVTGITMVAAVLVTLSTTAASAAPTEAANSSRAAVTVAAVTPPRLAEPDDLIWLDYGSYASEESCDLVGSIFYEVVTDVYGYDCTGSGSSWTLWLLVEEGTLV